MANHILQLESVTKRFGGLTAVNDVNIQLEEGELRCLVGPNGAGKSTVFRLVTGTYPPTSGRIVYRGKDLGGLSPFQRARLGISIKFQTPMVYYDQTLHQNMVIALQRHMPLAAARSKAEDMLVEFGIADAVDSLASDVAHGYRQWLEIGMAVAAQPNLLLLDEPTAGMSPEETAKTAALIHRLRGGGISIVVIDHDMEFVRMLNCRLTVMHLGRLFAEGSLAEIQADESVREIYLGKK